VMAASNVGMSLGSKAAKLLTAFPTFFGTSSFSVLLKIALKIANPTVPPTERTPITRPVAIEMSSFGEESWAVVVNAFSEIPIPTPKRTTYPRALVAWSTLTAANERTVGCEGEKSHDERSTNGRSLGTVDTSQLRNHDQDGPADGVVCSRDEERLAKNGRNLVAVVRVGGVEEKTFDEEESEDDWEVATIAEDGVMEHAFVCEPPFVDYECN